MSVNAWGFEQIFNVMRFPAGETHIEAKMTPVSGDLIIAPSVRNFEDLANVVMAERILNHNGSKGKWFIPYFPFARMDRRRHHRDGLEIKLAMEMMHGIDLTILDPHSDVAGALPYISQGSVVAQWMKNGLLDKPSPLFVIPDQGATKKALTWLNGREYVQASKTRDVHTGKLSGFDIGPRRTAVTDRHCIIVDDICDGGATFIGLAEKLHEYGARSLTLAVAHGLFTQGLDSLNKQFDRIFSTGVHQQDKVIRVKYADIYWGSGTV